VQYCGVKTAYEIADQLRAGATVAPEVLLAAHAELDGEVWSTSQSQAVRVVTHALLASSSKDAVHRAIAEIGSFAPGTIRGLLFDEGDGLTEAFPDNPWGIGPHATLVGAIDHVWDLFDAPELTNALLERVLGLVLLDTHDGPHLGYLHVHELSSDDIDEAFASKQRPPHDRRYAMQWLPYGDVAMFIGAAPSAASRGRSCAVPAPLQILYRVHGGMQDGMWRLSAPEHLITWAEMLDVDPSHLVRASNPDEKIRADQLVCFFGYGDDRSDLFDIRDPEAPLVRAWGDGQLYEGDGEPLLEWLEGQTSLILKISED
jgi:hypothetical protein